MDHIKNDARIIQERIMATLTSINENLVYTKDVKLSTMTIMVELDHVVDLNKVMCNFEKEDVKIFIKEVLGASDMIDIKKKGVNFSNSLVFKVRDRFDEKKEQAIKVFSNGSLHITGYKNILEVLEIADIFRTMIELIIGGDGISDWYMVSSFNIQLINFYTILDIKQGNMISLYKFYETCQKSCEYYTTFNNSQYAGLIIKANNFTILVFDSGNIIFTSLTSPHQLEEAYTFITNFFKNHSHKFVVNSGKETNKKNKKRKVKHFDYDKYILLK